MKKTIIIAIVAIMGLGMQSASAQIEFGVVGGLNLGKVNFKNSSENFSSSNKVGWFFGPKVEATIPIVGLGVDASLLYSQRGVNIEDDVAEKNSTLKTIEVPINVRYQFGFSSLAAVFISTGPQFGFNVGSGTINAIKSTKYEVKNSILTWNIGAGVKLIKHLEVGLGYNIALSKFAKVTGTQQSLKTNTFQVHVGYFF